MADEIETQTGGVPMLQKGAFGIVVLLAIVAIGVYGPGMVTGGDDPISVAVPDGNTYIKPDTTTGSKVIDVVPSPEGDTSISMPVPADPIDLPGTKPTATEPPVDTNKEQDKNMFKTTKVKMERYKQCLAKGREEGAACTGEAEVKKQGIGGKWTSTNRATNYPIGCGIYAQLTEQTNDPKVYRCANLCNKLRKDKDTKCDHKLGVGDGLRSDTEMDINLCAGPCSSAKAPDTHGNDCVSACHFANTLDFDMSDTPSLWGNENIIGLGGGMLPGWVVAVFTVAIVSMIMAWRARSSQSYVV
jgi:hypothetical protein